MAYKKVKAILLSFTEKTTVSDPTDTILVDPTLTPDNVNLPALLDSSSDKSSPALASASKGTSSVICEGIPPIATKLLDRIQKWEYVDLSSLIADSSLKPDELAFPQNNQIVFIQSVDQIQRRRKQITDLTSWLQAYTIYMAALASADGTSKEETAGLLAHAYLIMQLSKDLRVSSGYNMTRNTGYGRQPKESGNGEK